jgi:hypothetical protein
MDQTNGVVLIVENQLGDSDHSHLGQLLRGRDRRVDDRVDHHPIPRPSIPRGPGSLRRHRTGCGCQGRSGAGLNPVFGGQGKIRQELYIDWATPEQCRAVFDALHTRREDFEAAHRRKLDRDPLEGRKACRISDPLEGDVQDEANHERYIEFFTDAGQRLRTAIAAIDGASF